VTRISDSVYLRIGLEDQHGGYVVNPTDPHPAIALLVDNLPSSCLYPITDYEWEKNPLTEYEIKRVKMGRKGRNVSQFLHAMKLLVVKVYQADFQAPERYSEIGEDYKVIAMNWAWEDITGKREGMERWAGVDWRRRVFYGS
jgi:hypothetical protein